MKIFLPFLVVLLAAGTLCATSISGGGVLIETTPTPEPELTGKVSTAPISPYKAQDLQKMPDKTDLKNALPPVPVIPQMDNKMTTLPDTVVKPALDEFGRLMQAASDDFQARRFDAVMLKINKAEAMRPDNPDLMNFRGAIFAETGHFPEAQELYEKALKLQPTQFWPRFNLAEIEFMQKNYAGARAKFEDAMKIFPDNELLRFKIVLTYLMEKNETSARAELERFKFPSDTAAYYFAFASVEFVHGNQKAGLEWIDSSVRIFGRQGTDFLYQTIADLGWVPLPRPQ